MTKHTYLFTVLEGEDMLRGYFADFETLDTFGDTEEELLQRAKEILAVEILDMESHNEKLPTPSVKEDYRKSLGADEKLFSVTVDTDEYKHLLDEEEEV